MSKPMVLLALAALVCSLLIENSNAESTDVEEGRTTTLQLTGSNGNYVLYSALLIVPVLALIVLLDFAIFGTFARRSEELNPVSNFFYHVRRGLHISHAKYRRRYGNEGLYGRYGPPRGPGHRNRYTRFELKHHSPKALSSALSSTIGTFYEN